MQLSFNNIRLAETCSNSRKLTRAYGKVGARKIGIRLADLRAASSLADMSNLPGRCHELKGNLAGVFALDLDSGFRLLFTPDHDPISTMTDGGIDWNQVTRVCVKSIEDYHD